MHCICVNRHDDSDHVGSQPAVDLAMEAVYASVGFQVNEAICLFHVRIILGFDW